MVIQAGLFNQRSTDVERRQRLEEIIKKNQTNDDSEEEEIPKDEEINHMLARGDEEFQLFNELDKQRYERDKKLYPSVKENNYRLMKYDQVPDWVKIAPEPKKVITELGKRRRHKNKSFNNYDHLDDEDYFKILEQKFGDYDDNYLGVPNNNNHNQSDLSSEKSGYGDYGDGLEMHDPEERPKKKKEIRKP